MLASFPPIGSLKMAKVKQNLVDMVREHPAGLPLNRLAVIYSQTYRKNLTLSQLGFDSMTSLVSSLEEDLVVTDDVVFHRDHCGGGPATAGAECGAAAPPSKESDPKAKKRKEKILRRIVNMVKEHPGGIHVELVASAYKEKHSRGLAPAAVGFRTVSGLVHSLADDLVVVDDVVYHKTHRPPAGMLTSSPAPRAAPQRGASPQAAPVPQKKLLGSSLIPPVPLSSPHFIPLFPASQPAEELSQEQLYERILEVS